MKKLTDIEYLERIFLNRLRFGKDVELNDWFTIEEWQQILSAMTKVKVTERMFLDTCKKFRIDVRKRGDRWHACLEMKRYSTLWDLGLCGLWYRMCGTP